MSTEMMTKTELEIFNDIAQEGAHSMDTDCSVRTQPTPKVNVVDLRNSTVDKSADRVDSLKVSLMQVKEKLSSSLVSLDLVRPPSGLPTGLDVFDNFLLWKGLPKGDLTLLNGKPGTGATSLWAHAAQKIHEQKKWVAWINSDWDLMPTNLVSKKVDLRRLLVVKKPKETSQIFWVLQELISSSLFEMVGCHLAEGTLKIHQLQKLKKLARLHQVALVIISHTKQWLLNPLFSLVIECSRDFFTIKRALHRPTPFTVSGEMVFSPTALLS